MASASLLQEMHQSASLAGVKVRRVSIGRVLAVEWHLRQRMAERGMFQTTALRPLLAERGVYLSREQVFRLVTQTPRRLSMDTLAAICDALQCSPSDLIEVIRPES